MVFIILFLSVVFFSLAFVVNKDNAGYLLSGYNTMSQEEQQIFPLEKYLMDFKRFHLFLGSTLLLVGFIILFTLGPNSAGVFVTCYPILAYLIFSLKTAQYSPPAKRKWRYLPVYLLTTILTGMIIIMYYGFKTDELVIKDDSLRISGMYNEEILKSEIQSIEMVDTLPKIHIRMNGFAMGSTMKGYFKTRAGEKVKLIINIREKPFLLITKRSGKKIYYSPAKKNRMTFLSEIQKIIRSAGTQ